ncbi:S8 family serine peptidase [Mesorhizobium sp. M0317]|uniref:S8 family peptidase n=1 Tax=unclassified Mesorhizobium TaxID=325217 RepID=UPI00333889AE
MLGLGVPIDGLQELVPEGVQVIKAPEAWRHTKGRGASLCILSTGISRHEDLVHWRRESFVTGDGDPTDYNGNGTALAGIVGAAENGAYIVGAAPEAECTSMKFLGNNGSGTYPDLIRSLGWCVEQQFDVVALCFGGGGHSDELCAAISRLTDLGTVVVTGPSERDGRPAIPGCCPGVLSVAKPFVPSPYFPSIPDRSDVVTWAGRMTSTVLSGGIANDWYSMSEIALVTGAVALVKSVKPTATVDEVRALLVETGRDVPGAYPYRQVDAEAAVLRSLG